jgi:hypothetical protein
VLCLDWMETTIYMDGLSKLTLMPRPQSLKERGPVLIGVAPSIAAGEEGENLDFGGMAAKGIIHYLAALAWGAQI